MLRKMIIRYSLLENGTVETAKNGLKTNKCSVTKINSEQPIVIKIETKIHFKLLESDLSFLDMRYKYVSFDLKLEIEGSTSRI